MQALDIAQKYTQEIKSSGIDIKQSYLFGSHAKGRQWEGSDIDICIVSDYDESNYEKIKHVLNRTAIKLDARIEPVLFSSAEFANKYDALVAEVKQYGIVIN